MLLRSNGHDYNAIHEAILNAKAVQDKPSAIILHTIKGKGCTFAERTGAIIFLCPKRIWRKRFRRFKPDFDKKRRNIYGLSSNEQD